MIHNIEAEQALIGTILYDGSLIQKLTVQPEHIEDKNLRTILEAILEVEKKEQAIDVVTVVSALGDDKINRVGGVSYLTDLASSIASTESYSFYESLVYESYRERKSQEVAANYVSNPSDSSLHKLIKRLESLRDLGIEPEEKTTQDYLMEIAKEMIAPPGSINKGALTGFDDFDDMTGGAQSSDLIILAGRPSTGKTAFSLNMGNGHCENGGTTHIFSLEMGVKQLLQRTISAVGNINLQKWQDMSFSGGDYERAMNAIGIISSWNLFFHEKSKSINQIKSAIRKAVHNKPNEKHMVVIDYLQLILSSNRYERRDLEVGAMTRELKLLARELEIPIILLSQLSRGVEHRQDKRPMMSDLRESGNIEQDADVICFLNPYESYEFDADTSNNIELIISKQRNGPVGSIELIFQKEFNKFLNAKSEYESDIKKFKD